MTEETLIQIENLIKKNSDVNDKNKVKVLMFDLKEENLNHETGKNILAYLKKLEFEKEDFQLGHPLPPCLFDIQTSKKFTFKSPTSCHDCPSLFQLENKKRIVFCNNRKGPDLKFMNSRKQIWEYHELLKDYDKPKLFNKCKTCIHKIRGTCYYINNCRLEPVKKHLKSIKVTVRGC